MEPAAAPPAAPSYAALPEPQLARRRHRHRVRTAAHWLPVLLALYLIGAYVVAPAVWRRVEHHKMIVASAPKFTTTPEGIPGDPINIALAGTRDQVTRAMTEAGWTGADPINAHTSLKIAEACLRDVPYPRAPVSNLYLFGRVQDLAFQQAKGRSPRQRHHVRFWLARDQTGPDEAPLWLGAVTFDRSVGVSHRTGQITHHIDPDIDAERDKLVADLRAAGWVARTETTTGIGGGYNGGGDRYRSDGQVTIVHLANK